MREGLRELTEAPSQAPRNKERIGPSITDRARRPAATVRQTTPRGRVSEKVVVTLSYLSYLSTHWVTRLTSPGRVRPLCACRFITTEPKPTNSLTRALMLWRTAVLRRPAAARPLLRRGVHGEGGRAAAFEARSVLLLPKTPRWRHELASRGLSEGAARELLARGEAWPRAAHMCHANDAHAAAVAHLERCFGEAGIAVRTLAAAEATAADVAAHAPELVCTAGGDGTLLRTATLLPPSTPLLAINTDPERSTGALCSAHLSPHAAAASAAHVAASLRGGDFSVRPLPRLRATIEDAAGARTLLAINEVFVGEVDPVRPCALEVALDSGPVQERRASGLPTYSPPTHSVTS